MRGLESDKYSPRNRKLLQTAPLLLNRYHLEYSTREMCRLRFEENHFRHLNAHHDLILRLQLHCAHPNVKMSRLWYQIRHLNLEISGL